MRIVAIASKGGHWVQLLRLLPAFTNQTMVYVSTSSSIASTIPQSKFYSVPDATRWSKVRLFRTALAVCKIVFINRPDAIITTGSAPGLMGIIAGKIIGAKTIWIDSIANVERISLSGRLAVWFADRVYTQWPHLSNSKILFKGNIIE